MSANQRAIRGVLPVFQTPYHADYTIDFTTLEREIQWLFAQGADGIVMGMVSETLRLSGEERKALAESACRFGRKHGNTATVVIISTGAESTHTAVGYARHAESVGADGVMVIPPISVAVGEDELYRYYATIIEAITIPVVVQDASGYVGRPMSIAMQAALYNEYGDRGASSSRKRRRLDHVSRRCAMPPAARPPCLKGPAALRWLTAIAAALLVRCLVPI